VRHPAEGVHPRKGRIRIEKGNWYGSGDRALLSHEGTEYAGTSQCPHGRREQISPGKPFVLERQSKNTVTIILRKNNILPALIKVENQSHIFLHFVTVRGALTASLTSSPLIRTRYHPTESEGLGESIQQLRVSLAARAFP
jgi:hypothetical protein